MEKMAKFTVVLVCLMMAVGSYSLAQHDHGQPKPATPDSDSKPVGTLIKDSVVEKFSLSYYLLNKEERDQMMKGHEGMKMAGLINSPDVSHHLMTYIKSADGKFASGKVGFMITGPDGKEFKTMTMGMYNGYGADMILTDKGLYKIRTKAVIGKTTLNDEFDYEVK